MILERLEVGFFGVNCYLLGCEETAEAAVIDPGAEVEKIIHLLEKNNLRAKYLLVTHAHIDHVGELAHIKAGTGAKILMHQAEVPLLEKLPFQAATFGLPIPEMPQPDRFVDEGDVIKVGKITLKVIHTPGHSPGGLCFLHQDVVFVGDTLFAGSIGRTDLPGGSYNQLIHSIRTKLFVLDDGLRVYPGHGPDTTIGREKEMNPFFQ